MRYLVLALLTLAKAGCSTVNINAPQPNLQSINGGHPSCAFDCHTTQTATQSIGDGDVHGATITNQRSTSRALGAPAQGVSQ